MKSFKKFLNESYVGKDGKIYASKGEYEKTIKSLNNLIKKDGVQTKLNLGNTNTTNLPVSGSRVNRGPGRPVGSTTKVKSNIFQQPELDFKNKTSFTQSVKDGESLSRRMSSAFDKNKNIIPKENQIVNKKVVNNTNKVVNNTNKVVNTNNIKTNTKDIKKFQDLNKTIKDKQKVIDLNKKLASNKINTNINTTVPKPNFGNVTNINVNKGVKLPDFKPRSGTETILTQNQIQSRLDDIQNKNFEKLKRQNANNILKNLDTSDTDKLIPDKNVGRGTVVKPGDPIPDKKITGGVKSYRDFMKNVKNVNKVVKRTSPYLKGLTRVAVPVATALQAKSTYDTSRRAGMSKQRSLGRTLARGAGQIIGSAIGGTAGAIGGGGVGSLVTGGLGAAAGFDVGGSLATKAFDTFTTRSGRRQFRKSFSNFRKDLMNVDNNTLKKVNKELNKK